MMKTIPQDLKKWGVPKGDIHIEAFGADSVKARQKVPAPAAEKTTAVASQQITFSHSGKKLTWDTKFTSLLEFAAEHDVEIESACCAGGCGTCQVAVISGKVVYDQTPDCNIEEGCCLACVGRPQGDLVLDALVSNPTETLAIVSRSRSRSRSRMAAGYNNLEKSMTLLPFYFRRTFCASLGTQISRCLVLSFLALGSSASGADFEIVQDIDPSKVVGHKACAECHASEVAAWEKSPHAIEALGVA